MNARLVSITIAVGLFLVVAVTLIQQRATDAQTVREIEARRTALRAERESAALRQQQAIAEAERQQKEAQMQAELAQARLQLEQARQQPIVSPPPVAQETPTQPAPPIQQAELPPMTPQPNAVANDGTPIYIPPTAPQIPQARESPRVERFMNNLEQARLRREQWQNVKNHGLGGGGTPVYSRQEFTTGRP